MKIDIVIPGKPIAHQSVRSRISFKKGSKAITVRGEKYFRLKDLWIHHYQKKEIVKMVDDLRFVVRSQLPSGFKIFEREVYINKLKYVFPPITSLNAEQMKFLEAENNGSSAEVLKFRFGFTRIYKYTKPDLQDNLNKALFDAMQGVVFKHDSQVCRINNLIKCYGKMPRTEISIEGEI